MEDRTVVRNQAPPPPSEVRVRTMRSDLASMAQSGGGMPRFENVAIDGLSVEKEYGTPSNSSNSVMSAAAPTQFTTPTVAQAPIASVAPSQPTQSAVAEGPVAPKKDMYPIFIVAVVAILAIAAVGYFAYATFFSGPASTPTDQTAQSSGSATLPVATSTSTATTASSSVSTSSQTTTVAPSAELSATHISLFKKSADQVLTVDLTGVTAATYRKSMSTSLTTVSAASSMIEINPKGSDGKNLSIQGLFSVAGAAVLSPQALGSFAPDATFYVYRDKNGLWPGYVLSLNAGQTSSSVAAAVQQLESSANISNLFIVDPGTPSSDGFTGSMTAGIPVRILPFSGPSIPSYFTYGWYRNYLIVSTSKNGFAAAVADL